MKNKKTNLLFVEDNKDDQRAIIRFVGKHDLSFNYSIVGSVAEAIEALKYGDFNFVVADYFLGDGNALALLGQFNDIPMIVITGLGNEEIAVRAMKAGAYDYLVKGVDSNYLKILAASIEKSISRRNMELELKQYRENLEEKVEERTKEVFKEVENRKRATEKLRECEKEALKAQKLESVGILAGGIAHDFNNILTAILGNANLAEILLKSENTDKALAAISTIEKATIRASDLTQQLLTFAKGGAPIKKTSAISELIRESTGFALRGTNIKPEFFIPDTLWASDVDKGQVSRVINNLIINAAQAMPKGGTVYISVENITENHSKKVPSLKHGKYIKISVKDHGVGIPQEHIGNIFDPYFTTKSTGSGLGLAASYSIIKNHGGLITVESALDVGTTFYIYLPASSNTIAEKKDVEEDKPVTGSGKILIMDDNDAIRDMGSQTLSFIGYKVECAADGAEAIEMYKKGEESGKPFDVVIMDLTVPGGMGGEEAIGKLHEIYSEAKAIVSSGYSNDPVIAEYEKYGFKGSVSKPFEIKEMNKVLQKVING